MWKITTAFGNIPKMQREAIWKIPCGLEPLKTILRCKERPLEDIENSKILPLRGRTGGP